MTEENLNLHLSRIAISILKKIPREFLLYLRETDADVSQLVADHKSLNSMLESKRCHPVIEEDLTSSFWEARKEYEQSLSHSVTMLTIWDEEYPQRLLETSDFPRVLYRFGDCDLNSGDMLAIVGTRKCTIYGESFTKRIIPELKPLSQRLVIISGLAFGIDAAAHVAALQEGVPTIGILAHGFGTIYPAQHRDLARRIRETGGALITEYPWGTTPYRKHFLERNRIVAGMSDAVLVAESPVKGGAMSTANIAFSINRCLMALPGRISDETSMGCNQLIARQKAQLVTSSADIAHHMGLDLSPDNQLPVIPELFKDPQGDEKKIYDAISFAREPIQLDELCNKLRMPIANLMALLGEMEFDGLISRLPGNRFTIQ